MANRPLGSVLTRLRTILDPAEAAATDRELLRRFLARRDEAAFGELVRRHGPMVHGVCRRVLGDAHGAEDAFQATFLILVRRARAVRWRESLGGWLHGAACRVALRARATRERKPEAGRVARPSAAPDPAEEAAARELRRVLDQELQRLPAKMRAPLVLCDMEGMTHAQAARELGWPKGSLAKRLAGGRQRLRARLLRRGVAPSAGALAAVLAANEATGAPLAAAALLATYGAASTTATALAKGVIRTMCFTKLKTAAVVFAALVLAGSVAGVGAYRAWGARAAAPAPAAPNPASSPAENQETMPVDKAVVYHVGPAQGEADYKALAEGIAVVGGRPESIDDNIHLYLSVFEQFTRQKRTVPSGPSQAILAVGPVLNSGDEAVAVSLRRHGKELDLEMAYTSGEAEGKTYKRNVPWRPLVQVPIDLAPGRYRLNVTWQARKSLPDGEAWNDRTGRLYREFVVTGAGRRESKAVRVNGADFRAFAEGRIRAPVVGDERPVDFGMRIVNASDKPLVFYNVATMTLTKADGGELKSSFAPALFARLRPKWITLDPGEEMIPFLDVSLKWTPDGKELQLNVQDYEGNFWSYDDIKPGKYIWTGEYELGQSPDPTKPFWTGKVKTEPIEFEVLEGPHTSKPVSAQGLEFTAIAPAHVAAPAPGGTVDVNLGLLVTNIVNSKKVTVATFDVIRPRLVTADGKELEPAFRARKDTPRVTPPVTLDPGESWTWKPEATLSWTTDRAALTLGGPDGRGVAGEWSFATLHPGKYRLVVEYANEVAKYVDIPVWTGRAVSEPVEFEIVGP